MTISPEYQLDSAPTPPNRPEPNKPEYGTLFGAAFRLVKGHPMLWVAGLIATVLQGNANVNFNFNTNQPLPTVQQDGTIDLENFFANSYLKEILLHPTRYLLLSLLVVGVFFLIRLIFGTWAEAALVQMGVEAEATGRTSLSSGWRQARQRLSSLIGFQFLLTLPLMILFGTMIATFFPLWLRMMQSLFLASGEFADPSTVIDPGQFAGVFLLIPLFVCIAFPLTIAVAVINIYGLRSCLLAGTGPLESIWRGWRLFQRQLGYTLITALIYFVVGAVGSALIMVPILPFGLAIVTDFLRSGTAPDFFRQLLPLMAYLLLASVVVGGILHAFFATLWTKFYLVAEEQMAR